MYCKYVSNGAVNNVELMNDIVALLTGETNLNNLSNSCNKASSTFSNSVDLAGWVMHDAAAGTNKVVLKAATIDDPTQFKYVLLDSNTDPNRIYFTPYESWNDISHTGTNPIISTSQSYLKHNSVQSTIYIMSSAQRMVLHSNTSTNATSQVFIVETGREFTWLAIGQGYTPLIASTMVQPATRLYYIRGRATPGGNDISSGWVSNPLYNTPYLPSGGTAPINTDYEFSRTSSGSKRIIHSRFSLYDPTNQVSFPNILPSSVKMFYSTVEVWQMDELVISGVVHKTIHISEDSRFGSNSSWFLIPKG